MTRDDDNLFEDDASDDYPDDYSDDVASFLDAFDEDLDDEEPGPVPHPDDRLWRHPSELASIGTPSASAAPADPASFPAPSSLLGRDLPRTEAWRRARPLMATAATVMIIALGITQLNNVDETVNENASAVNVGAGFRGTQLNAVVADKPELIGQSGAAWQQRFHAELAPTVPTIIVFSDQGVTKQHGVIFDDDGHIVTAARGLTGAETIHVIDEVGNEVDATLVGTDAVSDLAVLSVGAGLRAATRPLVDAAPRVGDPVLLMGQVDHGEAAIGRVRSTRQRLDSSTTVSFFNAIIIDMPGDTALPGTPAFNETGSVIGMLTAPVPDPTNSSPDEFVTIPARTIAAVAQAIIDSGAAIWPWIGVELDIIDDPNSGAIGPNTVVAIASIHADSPAEHAGLRVGDRITSIEEQPVTSPEMIGRTIQSSPIGSSVVLGIDRAGAPTAISVILSGRADASVEVAPVPSPTP